VEGLQSVEGRVESLEDRGKVGRADCNEGRVDALASFVEDLSSPALRDSEDESSDF
jgi:hypothetical protein